MTHRFAGFSAGLLASVLAFAAYAHSTLESATPTSGSVLGQSPASIELKFKSEVRLTSVAVVQAGKPERKLQFSPVTGALKFSIATPALTAGPNEIQWKALSKDGHVMSGKLTYTIKPATTG